MPTDISRSPFRRLLRWMLWTAGSLFLIGVLGFVYITFIGITVDASQLRGRTAAVFSDALGREVRFEGPMELEISARPKLRVGGLHIANAPGFTGGDFASLGEARLALDLWPLLRRRLQIEEVTGSQVRVRLQSSVDGANNWTFLRARRGAQQRATVPGTSAANADRALALLDIQQVTLENLNVEYVGPAGKSHYFDLHKLSAQSPSGRPLKVTLNGAVEREFPYRLDFTGGVPADLSDPAKPWPVEMTLTFLSSTLTANGSLSGLSGQIGFGLGTENLLEFERLFQTKLPPVGASGIAGTLAFEPGKVSLKQLGAAMGDTALIGDLDFDYSAAKPRVSGALTVPVLDLRPFLVDRPTEDAPAAPPRSLAEVYRELSRASFTLTELTRADADVTLSVGRWVSLPGDVSDVSLRLKIENGILQTPMQATVTGVKLQGDAHVDGTASPPTFRLALGTRDSDLGGLAELLVGVRGVEGKLGRFDLRLAARGDQVSELVRSLDVRLDIERGRLSYGNLEGGRPVEFTLEKLAVALPAGEGAQGRNAGFVAGRSRDCATAQRRAGAADAGGSRADRFQRAFRRRARAHPRRASVARREPRAGIELRDLRASRRRGGKLVRPAARGRGARRALGQGSIAQPRVERQGFFAASRAHHAHRRPRAYRHRHAAAAESEAGCRADRRRGTGIPAAEDAQTEFVRSGAEHPDPAPGHRPD